MMKKRNTPVPKAIRQEVKQLLRAAKAADSVHGITVLFVNKHGVMSGKGVGSSVMNKAAVAAITDHNSTLELIGDAIYDFQLWSTRLGRNVQ